MSVCYTRCRACACQLLGTAIERERAGLLQTVRVCSCLWVRVSCVSRCAPVAVDQANLAWRQGLVDAARAVSAHKDEV